MLGEELTAIVQPNLDPSHLSALAWVGEGIKRVQAKVSEAPVVYSSLSLRTRGLKGTFPIYSESIPLSRRKTRFLIELHPFPQPSQG